MLELIEKVEGGSAGGAVLSLPYEQRIKSRLRTCLSDGTEVGVLLPRSTVMYHGDWLRSAEGITVRVEAAAESVSTVSSPNPRLLALACYHLGNRHMALQIGEGWVRYLHDHVIDDMVRGLGLEVMAESAPFEPESGAYGGHAFQGGGHGGDHGHGHHH
jgi:urease accessory protein